MDTVADHGAARELLTAYVRTSSYTSALEELPAPIAIDQAKRGLRPGVRYLDAGWQPGVDALADQARRAGAEIRLHAKAQALLDTGGVRLADGSELGAGRVIIAGLGPRAAGHLLATAGGWVPVDEPRPVEAACLDVALQRLPRGDQRFVMGVDAPLFLTEITRAARRSAPDGGSVIHVVRYLRDGADRGERAELEGLLDLAQPGWRAQLVHARYMPRMSVVEHMGSRPAMNATGRADVLLAGDWIGHEGWLADAALASGEAAGARAATDLRGARVTTDRPDARVPLRWRGRLRREPSVAHRASWSQGVRRRRVAAPRMRESAIVAAMTATSSQKRPSTSSTAILPSAS